MSETETSARERWCPFARVAGLPGSAAGGLTYNRWPEEQVTEARCVASGCMAWRWKPLMADAAYLAAVTKAMATQPNHKSAAAHVNDNRADYGLPTKPFLGYCGLAGKPEPT